MTKLRFERYFSHHQTTQMIMLRIFKEKMRIGTETIELVNRGENAMAVIEVIRQ